MSSTAALFIASASSVDRLMQMSSGCHSPTAQLQPGATAEDRGHCVHPKRPGGDVKKSYPLNLYPDMMCLGTRCSWIECQELRVQEMGDACS